MATRPTGPDAAVEEPKAAPAAPRANTGGFSEGVQIKANEAKLSTATLLAAQGIDADDHLPRAEQAVPGPAEPFDESALSLEPETFVMDCDQRSITVLAGRMPVIIRGVLADPGEPGFDIEGRNGRYTTPTLDEMKEFIHTQVQAQGRLQETSDGDITEKAEALIRRIKRILLHDHPLARGGKIRRQEQIADDAFTAAAQRLAALAEARGNPNLAKTILANLPNAGSGPSRDRSRNVMAPPVVKMPGQ